MSLSPTSAFSQAFLSGSLLELTIFLPFLADHGARALAKRRVGTAGDPRGAGRGSRAHGEPGRVREIVADRMLRTRRIDPMRRRARRHS